MANISFLLAWLLLLVQLAINVIIVQVERVRFAVSSSAQAQPVQAY